jgi:hypothetical protein
MIYYITPLDYFWTVNFVDYNTGWVSGDYGKIVKTTNSGLNWIDQTSGTNKDLLSASFYNNNIGWIVGNDGEILNTTNGGNNWIIQTGVTSNFLYSVNCVNNFICWAVGGSGTVIKTTNGGANWILIDVGIKTKFNSVNFINQNTGWIVGDNGFILKTTNGGTVFISRMPESIPEKYYLSQNYPNPFNPSTKIKFDLKEDGRIKMEDVKLTIYDILGREVQTLVNEQLQPGTYEVTFNGSNLPSGIYFYQLKAGDYVETRKMLLIK